MARGRWAMASTSVRLRPRSWPVAAASAGDWPNTTRVSASASRPAASFSSADPSAPAARRSDTRCTTTTLATPSDRESLNVAWAHRAVAGSLRMAHASSITTRVLPPRPAPSPDWSHAVSQVITRGGADDVKVAERSSTVTAASGSRPAVVGPSNIPARSPWIIRRSSRAGARPDAVRPATSVPTEAAASASGRNSASTRSGRVGAAARRDTWRTPSSSAVRSSGCRPRRSEDAVSDATSSTRARNAASGSAFRAPPGPSNGLSRTGPPGARSTGDDPDASANAPYSPFGSMIHARRPKATSRHTSALTKLDLPRPTWPRTRMFGLVRRPARYSSHGSKENGAPSTSLPTSGPWSPMGPSDTKGYTAWRLAVVARWDGGGRTARLPQAPSQGERPGEGLPLATEEPAQLHPRRLGQVLDVGAGRRQTFGVVGADGDVAAEAEGLMPVGQLLLPTGRPLALPLPPGAGEEPGPGAQGGIGQIGRPGRADLADSHRGRDRGHQHRHGGPHAGHQKGGKEVRPDLDPRPLGDPVGDVPGAVGPVGRPPVVGGHGPGQTGPARRRRRSAAACGVGEDAAETVDRERRPGLQAGRLELALQEPDLAP